MRALFKVRWAHRAYLLKLEEDLTVLFWISRNGLTQIIKPRVKSLYALFTPHLFVRLQASILFYRSLLDWSSKKEELHNGLWWRNLFLGRWGWRGSHQRRFLFLHNYIHLIRYIIIISDTPPIDFLQSILTLPALPTIPIQLKPRLTLITRRIVSQTLVTIAPSNLIASGQPH